MQIEKITLPAFWASALINGDYTGFDYDADTKRAMAELARCEEKETELAAEGWWVVDCEAEPRFTWHYRLYDPGADCVGGEVLEYTIMRAGYAAPGKSLLPIAASKSIDREG